MRIHRVYLPDLREGNYLLHGEEAYHLLKVLRVKEGSGLMLFNGEGLEAKAVVTQVHKSELELEIMDIKQSQNEAAIQVKLAVALLKGDKLSDVVRASTELGVQQIQLFTSQQGDVPDLSKNKLERLRKITREAAKQSGRAVVPKVIEPIKLRDLPITPLTLVAHPYSDKTLSDVSLSEKTMTIVTGPEGGLSEEEISSLESKGATTIQFGKRILRAETAPIAFLSAIYLPEAL